MLQIRCRHRSPCATAERADEQRVAVCDSKIFLENAIKAKRLKNDSDYALDDPLTKALAARARALLIAKL
jgi:hypothetical protein